MSYRKRTHMSAKLLAARLARDRAPFEAAEEIERLRALLRRGMRQLEAWQEFYGRHCNGPTMGNVLPPAGDVQWAEDVGEALATPNVKCGT